MGVFGQMIFLLQRHRVSASACQIGLDLHEHAPVLVHVGEVEKIHGIPRVERIDAAQ